MAKRKPVLKWRKVKGEWRAGPFRIGVEKYDFGEETCCYIRTIVPCGGRVKKLYMPSCCPKHTTIAAAKSACEKLARRIIAATRKVSNGKA